MKQCVILIAICLSLLSNAQKKLDYKYDNIPLSKVIKDVEKKNNITFSFAVDIISEHYITLDLIQIDYIELISILEAQTGLTFKQVTDNQITIAKKKLPDNMVWGYILDEITHLPIPYATIEINDEETYTNFNGFFSFNKKENSSFSISKMGYLSKKIDITSNYMSILLATSNIYLDNVIVYGYITSGIDRNKDGSIDVTQKTLGILPGLVTPDILQSIQLVPGITSLDESANGLQIRGGSPDQNLVLFDDIKIYNSGYLYGMFSAFNPYATEKATIFKSGTNPEYGDRISGVIDISTGTKIPEKTLGGFGVDGLSLDAYLKTPISNKTSLYLFARRSYTDIAKSPTYESYADKIFRNGGPVKDSFGNLLDIETDDEFTEDSSSNTFNFYDFSVKFIYKPSEKDEIILSSIFTRNTLDFSFTSFGETKIDSLITKNNGLSLAWRHQNSSKRTQEITAYFSDYKSHYTNDEIENNALEEINIRENTISDFGLNYKSIYRINDLNSISYGYQLSNVNLNVNITKTKPTEPEENLSLIQKDANLKNALFGEYIRKTKNLGIISAGIRFVNYSNTKKTLIEPRINAEYPISKAIRIQGSLERRHQPISQLVEFNQTELRLENNLWRLSDNEMYPLLKSDQISFGLLFNQNGWTLDIDSYYKKLSGLTTFTNGFSTPQLELSQGKSSIKGLDILLKKRIDNYRVWLGYTYNDIDFNFPSIQSQDFPGNNDIKHSFRISNSIRFNNVKFSLGWQYRTGEPFTPITNYDSNNQFVTFGNINSERLENYHRLDASLIYDFKINNEKKWKGQLGFSALNIYNRKVPISITYRTEQENNNLKLKQVIQRFSLGFTSNVSFRLFF